jgi:hypothetical protein
LEAYEKEIESLSTEANSVVTKMKTQIDKLKDNSQVLDKFKEINKKFEDSFCAFSIDIDRFKKEVAKNVGTSKVRAGAQLRQPNTRLSNSCFRTIFLGSSLRTHRNVYTC